MVGPLLPNRSYTETGLLADSITQRRKPQEFGTEPNLFPKGQNRFTDPILLLHLLSTCLNMKAIVVHTRFAIKHVMI